MSKTQVSLRHPVAQERTEPPMSIVEPKTPSGADEAASPAFSVSNLSVWYGEKSAIQDVTMDISPEAVTAIISPSGCGKATFLRSPNRMLQMVPSTWVDVKVLY